MSEVGSAPTDSYRPNLGVRSTDRLSAVDRAWLRMEQPASPMTILGLVQLEEPINVEEVRSLLEERLLRYPRFSMRFSTGRFGRMILEDDPGFDVARHVRSIPAPESESDLLRLLEERAASLLPDDRSPWEVIVVEEYEGGALIIPLLHHSLGDGIALIQVLVSLCDDPPAHRPPLTADASRTKGLWSRLRSVISESIRLILLRPDPHTSVKAELTGVKRVGWSHSTSVAVLRSAAEDKGVTINDLVTSAVSGALGQVLNDRNETEVHSLRAMVPFNLRNAEVGQPLGNRFGLLLPSLPVAQTDSLSRLAEVHDTMSRLKSRTQGAASFFLLNVMGISGRIVESLLVRFFGRKSSLVITNVPGPQTTLHLSGRPIGKIMFWVPQAGGLALGLSVMSYAGDLTLGVLADEGSLEDPMVLIDAYEKELAHYGVSLG